jgi:glycosyltransferase involved in cell wall biosynthesis
MTRRSISTRRFDVAFYVPWIGPLLTTGAKAPTGGAETQVFLLARALARHGLKICLVVFDLPGTPIPSSFDGLAIAVRPPYRTHERLGKLRETGSLFRAVTNAKSEVIVTRTAGPEIGLAALFAKLTRRRFVYSSANVSDFDFLRVSPKRTHDRLFRLGVHLADHVVVQTEEQVRLCEERFGRSPVLIKSIAEPASQRDRVPQAFLWIGRLVWYKQPLAFISLARALPHAKFWMVGVPSTHDPEGPALAAALQEQAAAVPNLELLSPRPRAALMDLVERAVAVVNTADFEGMPNIFLEGWARGVPALSLSHDPDGVIERNGLGAFAHGSTETLAVRASRLWEQRTSQADIAQRCRRYITENHSAEAVSSQWLDVLGR